MKVMILAAGRGRRLRPLTDTLPKPLLLVDQWSLIEHLLFRLARDGFSEVVINLAHLGDKILEKLGDGERYGVRIFYSHEKDPRGLETGGGIYQALDLLGEAPFLVVSGDIWTDYPFAALRNRLAGLAHLVMVNNQTEKPEGDFYINGARLTLEEGQPFTFGGIGVLSPRLFEACSPGFYPLAPLLREAIKAEQVTGEHYQGEWRNVGTLPELLKLREDLNHR